MRTIHTITILRPQSNNGSSIIRSGNQVTAERWQLILTSLGHTVDVTTFYRGAPADLLVAIHAWRSAEGIARFARANPGAPIIVCLSGTDVYAFQASHPEATLASMNTATALVGLHDLVGGSIPARFRDKLRVIYQSALSLPRRLSASDTFDVCVIGHLRTEKDPFRAAAAARLLPEQSRIRILHAGGPADKCWEAQARAEMRENSRYEWLGDLGPAAIQELLASSKLMVLSSEMEGGANVLGEAIAAGLPVIASAIDGSLGLLGLDYPGKYPVGDTEALARILDRAEQDDGFLAALSAHCARLAPQFSVELERASWAKLITDVTGSSVRKLR